MHRRPEGRKGEFAVLLIALRHTAELPRVDAQNIWRGPFEVELLDQRGAAIEHHSLIK
jgi:hypothetical protein